MTWTRRGGELTLCFNRDEQHSRLESFPPHVWLEGFVAPLDMDAGGTWLAVKPDGTVLALLNHYPPSFTKCTPALSRGTLIAALAARPERPTPALLRSFGAESMNPFRLVALSLKRAVIFTWNGKRLSRNEMQGDTEFITSSSWHPQAVTDVRHEMFRRWLQDNPSPELEAMIQFHSMMGHPRGGAFAVCMNREDARSVSMNTVHLTRERAEMTQQFRAVGEKGFSATVHRAHLDLLPAQ